MLIWPFWHIGLSLKSIKPNKYTCTSSGRTKGALLGLTLFVVKHQTNRHGPSHVAARNSSISHSCPQRKLRFHDLGAYIELYERQD